MDGAAQVKTLSASAHLRAAYEARAHGAREPRRKGVGLGDIGRIEDVTQIGSGEVFRPRSAFAPAAAVGWVLAVAGVAPHDVIRQREGVLRTEWGATGGPYYEQAMQMRSRENTVYFASVNYALRFQESATSLIDPSGRCQAYLPYGQEGVLVQGIRVEEATGLMATRYAPERYQEFTSE